MAATTLGDGVSDSAARVLLRIHIDGDTDSALSPSRLCRANFRGVCDRVFAHVLGVPAVSGTGCSFQQADVSYINKLRLENKDIRTATR